MNLRTLPRDRHEKKKNFCNNKSREFFRDEITKTCNVILIIMIRKIRENTGKIITVNFRAESYYSLEIPIKKIQVQVRKVIFGVEVPYKAAPSSIHVLRKCTVPISALAFSCLC
jgi:hypothetical protein